MLCNIKPVPFHESVKHIFAKIPGVGGGGGGVRTPGPPHLDPPMGSNWNSKVHLSQYLVWPPPLLMQATIRPRVDLIVYLICQF